MNTITNNEATTLNNRGASFFAPLTDAMMAWLEAFLFAGADLAGDDRILTVPGDHLLPTSIRPLIDAVRALRAIGRSDRRLEQIVWRAFNMVRHLDPEYARLFTVSVDERAGVVCLSFSDYNAAPIALYRVDEDTVETWRAYAGVVDVAHQGPDTQLTDELTYRRLGAWMSRD